jgi:hypothetical protein
MVTAGRAQKMVTVLRDYPLETILKKSFYYSGV